MSATQPPPETAARRAAMALLAQARAAEIAQGLERIGHSLHYVELRPPATGLVMVRGRVGGDGAPFNLGETTVTRAAVRLDSGETGFSYALGRDHDKARLAAVCDALWQSAERRVAVEQQILAPSEPSGASRPPRPVSISSLSCGERIDAGARLR